MATVRRRPERKPQQPRRVRNRRPPESPVVAVRDLEKHFGATAAVDGLTFSIRPGTVTGFLGPNGAGKTTTIRAILGLARPDAGEALVFGKPYRDLADPLSRVGTLIDGSAFHPRRSARAHLRAVAATGGFSNGDIERVLGQVDLELAADRKAGDFSLGMKQRLGLATALLGNPDLLILDEPANGLDPAGVRWLRAFLRDFAASGRTVFVSSHVLAEMAQLADEVIVIRRGRLITHTTVEGLTATTSVVVRTPQMARLVRAIEREGGKAEATTDELEVTGLTVERVGEIAAREKIVLHELTRRTHSLEDVFLELTRSKGDT